MIAQTVFKYFSLFYLAILFGFLMLLVMTFYYSVMSHDASKKLEREQMRYEAYHIFKNEYPEFPIIEFFAVLNGEMKMTEFKKILDNKYYDIIREDMGILKEILDNDDFEKLSILKGKLNILLFDQRSR